MGFRILYKPLFEVTFRHNYHLNRGADEFASLPAAVREQRLEMYGRSYDIRDDFEIWPTSETKSRMNGLDMVFKPISTGFVVGASVTEPVPDRYVLRRLPVAPLRLRFLLRLKRPLFWNYTNLGLTGQQGSLYYFSNFAAMERRTVPFLSLRPPIYREDVTYQAGDLVRQSGRPTVLYQSLRNANADDPFDDETTTWAQLRGEGYVNGNDRVRVYPPLFNYSLSFGSVVEAAFTLEDLDRRAFEVGHVVSEGGEPVAGFPLDLRAFEPGRYRLRVEGGEAGGAPFVREDEIYLDPALPSQGVFALVEIFHRSGWAQEEYGLLDPDSNQLLQPVYIVHFLNRYTFWRYRYNLPPEPVPAPDDFEQVNDRQFVTRAAIPSTSGFVDVSSGAEPMLPNPSPRSFMPEADRAYSDVYIHN